MRVRQARPADADRVAAFAADTWPEREADDYVPEAFPEWVASDGPDQHTAVVTVDGEAVACGQATLLTDTEGWCQGLRVAPDHRGAGHGQALTEYLLRWCGERVATARSLVFDWNPQGMGVASRAGFEPAAVVRFVRVEAGGEGADLEVSDDPARAWAHWTASDARTAMAGTGLDREEAWALRELHPESFEAGRALALADGERRAATVRIGTRDSEYRGTTVADYAAVAWEPGLAEPLFDAVRADAARAGAREARVCVPGTARHVAGAARARATFGEGCLLFAAALSRR
jgi:GNAT superfamily N-acetyltransferase